MFDLKVATLDGTMKGYEWLPDGEGIIQEAVITESLKADAPHRVKFEVSELSFFWANHLIALHVILMPSLLSSDRTENSGPEWWPHVQVDFNRHIWRAVNNQSQAGNGQRLFYSQSSLIHSFFFQKEKF